MDPARPAAAQARPRAPTTLRGLAAHLPPALVAAALAAAYARTLAPGVTWANDGADSGDLIAAAATLGIAHPTGYPAYLMLARLFQLIPLGDLAVRTTLLSAAAGVIAALVVYEIVRAILGDLVWRAKAAAGIAALALGLAPVFWSQAVVAEVYTLNALFVALIVLWTLWTIQRRALAPWQMRVQGLIVGLALGNHVTAGIAAAIWFAAVVWAPAPGRFRLAAGRALWAGVGLLVYLYLPLRAAAHPPINWGDPHDWAGFWWVVSGQPYRGLAFGLPADRLYGRVAAWAALLVQQFGWIGLGLGCFGLLYGAPKLRPFVWLSAGAAALASVFAVTYNTDDSYAYLIPTFLIFAIWVGLGADLALGALARWRPPAAIGLAGILLILAGWHAWQTLPQVDASHDRRAIDFAAGVLAAAPPHAMIAAESDLDAFPIWYGHYALGQRPDLVVLVDPLLDFDWYRRNLRAVYPALVIPAVPDNGWLAALAAANPRMPLCRTSTAAAPALSCAPPLRAP